MPAKKTTAKPLVAEGAAIGEPVPRAVVDKNTASVGIPPDRVFWIGVARLGDRRAFRLSRERVSEPQQAG